MLTAAQRCSATKMPLRAVHHLRLLPKADDRIAQLMPAAENPGAFAGDVPELVTKFPGEPPPPG